MHRAKRLLREVEVLQKLLSAEGRADYVGLRDIYQVVFAELEAHGLDTGLLEDVGHYRHAEVVVGGGPEVELRVALAVRDLDLFGKGGEGQKMQKQEGEVKKCGRLSLAGLFFHVRMFP